MQWSFNTPGAVAAGDVLTLRGVADANGDGVVDVTDFLLLLAAWGPCGGCCACICDFDGDCAVGATDFLLLLANWD